MVSSSPDRLPRRPAGAGEEYGENHYPVAPGRHVVAGQAEYMQTYGRAHLEADLAPGQRVDYLVCRPLAPVRQAGVHRVEKQPRKGAWMLWVLGAIFALLVVLAVVGALTSS